MRDIISFTKVKQALKQLSDLKTLVGTGGVESSGTDYVRFNDGTQICFKVVTCFYYNKTMLRGTYVFPKAFKTTPVVNFSPDIVSETIAVPNTTVVSRIANASTTAVDVVISRIAGLTYGDFVDGNQTPGHVYAIGRWK